MRLSGSAAARWDRSVRSCVERGRVVGGGRVLADIVFGHALEPFEAGRARRGQPDQDGGPIHPIGKQRGAGECVRPAAGAPHHGKLVDLELFGNDGDIAGGVGDRASRHPGRAAIARPVVGDELDAQLVEHHAAWFGAAARAGGSVEKENRSTVGCAGHFDRQQASIVDDHLVCGLQGRPPGARRVAAWRVRPGLSIEHSRPHGGGSSSIVGWISQSPFAGRCTILAQGGRRGRRGCGRRVWLGRAARQSAGQAVTGR